ncbi:hypothetical protein [Vitiosangium sp. GDMCC 1.1324]|uniref:hypothetical protein n=1 Tax=Vitiosangium sp. (strain GDMCC 1.1324) TaxID=2138576 RepID=UPI000D3762B2|nr:hypothetical protein [Vitiosangium sp. GDMCC 1.1324]PTL78199.1 hypothetical protein DAT35_39765 [Vitiosangium sp. GDMCC 1.1324]
MKRWTQGVVCAGLLVSAGSALAAPADVFDRERLAKYAKDNPEKIFDDPRISCYLRELLSKDDYEVLLHSMDSMSGEGPDAKGVFTFEGKVTGLADRGIVMLEPGGHVWVAIGSDEAEYFTNDPGSLQKPPAAIEAWRVRFEDMPLTAVSAKRKMRPEEIAQRCSAQKLAAEMERFAQMESGSVCKEGLRFHPFLAAAVKGGSPEGRVYFFSEPVPCPASGECKSRKKAYLVENDGVELPEGEIKKNGFVCALYRNAKGKKSVGWLPESALESEPLKLPVGSTALGKTPEEWLGSWNQENKSSSSSVTLRAAGPQEVQVNGHATNGANTGEFESKLTVSGPLLVYEDKEDGCVVRMRLLNNALYVGSEGTCGGMGVGYQGLHYRK